MPRNARQAISGPERVVCRLVRPSRNLSDRFVQRLRRGRQSVTTMDTVLVMAHRLNVIKVVQPLDQDKTTTRHFRLITFGACTRQVHFFSASRITHRNLRSLVTTSQYRVYSARAKDLGSSTSLCSAGFRGSGPIAELLKLIRSI